MRCLPGRVVLDFRLTDGDGKVVSAGHRDLGDLLYLTRAVRPADFDDGSAVGD